VLYCKHTRYVVIKEAGKVFLEYHLTRKEKSDWDIAWFDGPINIKVLKEMQYHQRVNQVPGMYNLARKNMLGRHLMRMGKILPNEYDFFPYTYMMPHDYKDFIQDTADQKHPRTFIVKPEDQCQGKGIFLTRSPDDVKPTDQLVVQKYLHKPHLIDGFKYDLRIYVLLCGISPLRVYIYKDGLARFATEKYEKPSEKNTNNLFMHLTNYAINKESENFV
jgi:tubulin polyglutamylase TTLL6/13